MIRETRARVMVSLVLGALVLFVTACSGGDLSPKPAPRPEGAELVSREEALVQEFAGAGGQFVAAPADCARALETEPWCIVVRSAEPVSQPEWETLFPATAFYLIKTELRSGEVPAEYNLLVVEQDGVRYGVSSFQSLLDANGIQASEENQETIARALALMMVPDYIAEGVHFQAWEAGEWPSSIRANFDHRLVAWTELGGFEIQWPFMFHNGDLLATEGWIMTDATGDYTPVPAGGPRSPSPANLEYWR